MTMPFVAYMQLEENNLGIIALLSAGTLAGIILQVNVLHHLEIAKQ